MKKEQQMHTFEFEDDEAALVLQALKRYREDMSLPIGDSDKIVSMVAYIEAVVS